MSKVTWELPGSERTVTYNPFCRMVTTQLRLSIENYRDAGIVPDQIIMSHQTYAMLVAVINFDKQTDSILLPKEYMGVPIAVTDQLKDTVAYDIVTSADDEFLRV